MIIIIIKEFFSFIWLCKQAQKIATKTTTKTETLCNVACEWVYILLCIYLNSTRPNFLKKIQINMATYKEKEELIIIIRFINIHAKCNNNNNYFVLTFIWVITDCNLLLHCIFLDAQLNYSVFSFLYFLEFIRPELHYAINESRAIPGWHPTS